PATIAANPIKRARPKRSPTSSAAKTAVYSGSEPGSNTAACDTGAKKKPLYAKEQYPIPAVATSAAPRLNAWRGSGASCSSSQPPRRNTTGSAINPEKTKRTNEISNGLRCPLALTRAIRMNDVQISSTPIAQPTPIQNVRPRPGDADGVKS